MTFAQALLVFVVLAPAAVFTFFGLAWLAGWSPSERIVTRTTGIIFAAMIFALAGMVGSLTANNARSISVSFGNWFTVQDYHFPLVLLADRLSLPFLAITAILCGLIGQFSSTYLHRESGFLRFFLLLHLFAFGSLLAFAAGSFDLLVGGWEIVGITSVLLIAFFHQRTAPVDNSLRVFAIYRACDIGLLVAIFAMHQWTGSASFAAGLPKLTVTQSGTVGLLLLLAAAGKSAQIPFSGWLPRAMEGPTPSSAIFYGAISVHAGAYLLLRVQPILAQSWLACAFIVLVGLATAVHGTIVGRACADAKTSLAYASLSQLGVIFAEIGLGWNRIAVIHIAGHAMVRTLQFLRSPSMLHDYHAMHSAVGGDMAPTGRLLDELFPKRIQLWLYRWALDRGHLDTLLDRFFVEPLRELSRAFARFDRIGLRESAPPPEVPANQGGR